MALSIIGAGYGRTGTLSLKYALEALGYDKCHHMLEVIHDPAQQSGWLNATLGKTTNWDELLAGFQATVDWPACHFYQELADYYHDAKVLLSVRDPHEWYQSMRDTTLRVISRRMADSQGNEKPNLGIELVVKAAFDGILDDPDHGIAIFNRHIEQVKSSIAPERLLIFDVREGWEPLCSFLDKQVPKTPFPRVNSREEFDEIFFGGGPDQ